MEIVWSRIIFGIVLLGIWSALRFKPEKKGNPEDLKHLQDNLVQIIQNSSLQTAILTAGLLSVVLGL
jgi:hypothetical protein